MKQAASLLLLRDPDDLHVYWVRRSETTRFLSGFHAFPGGGVEPDETPVDAAVRETFEETGYLYGVGRATGRAAVRAGEVGCPAVDTTALTEAGTWISPPYLGATFQTWYFVGWVAEDDGPSVDPGDPELASGEWIRPAEALKRWEAGQALLVPPTLWLLRALMDGAAQDPERFTASAESRGEAIATTSFFRPHVQLFPVRTPTLPPATHTNCYIVGDDVITVIDPASPYPEERAALDAAIDARISAGARVHSVILTHHHLDHVGGAQHLSDRLSVPILAHPITAERVECTVHGYLDEGDRVQLGQHALDVLFTPGHAPGHLCFIDVATGSAIVGDMVAGLGTILIEPGDGDMAAYLHQLGRLRDRAPTCLMPSHGQMIGGAVPYLSHYIAHRLARESKVFDALTVAGDSVATLVERAYADAPPIVRMGPDGGIAGLSLQSHLEKLAQDGRARQIGTLWRRA